MLKIREKTSFVYIIIALYLLTSITGSIQRASASNFEAYVLAATENISNGLASLVLYPPITAYISIIEAFLLVALFLFFHILFKVSSNSIMNSILHITVVFICLVIIGFSVNAIIQNMTWGYYLLCISNFLLTAYGLFVISHFYVLIKAEV